MSELDLDEVEMRVAAIASRDGASMRLAPYQVLVQDVPALVAEVRRQRDVLGRVGELADAWNETPDYAPSHYDRGRVEQRHDMTDELWTALGT